ncbi:MAG: transcriptional repressor [Bdellovibrionales bacterium]|nr:transcriptional repressor [Bdellovibrionales bacterium]
MKKHSDLIAVLRSNKMRITPARRILLQFILDNSKRQLGLSEIHGFIEKRLPGTDRSSIYRNLETFKELDIIQELTLPHHGKRFQYVFDGPVRHFYICKTCGKSHKGDEKLFRQIEAALKQVQGFSRANLSAVFYGHCSKCTPNSNQGEKR